MSKAFTREEDQGGPVLVPARAPLPAGVPNYVTVRGLRELRDEQARLEAERAMMTAAAASASASSSDLPNKTAAIETKIAALANRVASALLVEPPERGATDEAEGAEQVRFGATVTVRPAKGAADGAPGHGGNEARRFTIVGVDEADARAGRVAFVAPISRALLGRRVGDVVTVHGGRGDDDLEIVAIAYEG